MKSAILPLLLGLVATPLAAHPHVFVDTGFELILDDSGRLTQVRVTWQYDDFYSLLITEDMGLDTDGDGTLTATETEQLTGFDMQWVDGFNGDLEITEGDALVALSGPQEITANFADGRITTTHLRALDTPIEPGRSSVIRAYDPTYYTAYEVTRPITVAEGGVCQIRLKGPELNEGLEALQQQIAKLDPGSDPQDAGLPDIGAQMASSVIVTCDAP